MDFDTKFQFRLDDELKLKLIKIKESNEDKYDSMAHVMRVAIIRLYREEIEQKIQNKIDKQVEYEVNKRCKELEKKKERLSLTKEEKDYKK